MKLQWNKALAAVAISASLLAAAANMTAIASDAPSTTDIVVRYNLTNTVQVEVKSVLNERTQNGTKVGVVVRLYNTGNRMTRVPDYALRVKSGDGTEYTLRPSATNAPSIQPQEKVELSYLVVLDRNDDFSLTSLYWVNIDEFEYPIKETTVLTLPLTGEWKGNNASLSEQGQIIPWKQPFTIPVLSRNLQFTPFQLTYQNSTQGPVAIVGLIVENKGTMKETLPNILIDGNSDKKAYHGKRIAPSGTVTLEAGEKQQLYYAVPLETGVTLKSLTVLNQESFQKNDTDKTNVDFNIGRLAIQLDTGAPALTAQPELIIPGSAISFDPLNKLVQQGVEVSMVELHLHGAEGEGYQTAVAKFKLQNKTDRPLPVPNFQAELRTLDGFSYAGARQTTASQELLPNLGYIINYSFNLPNSEKGTDLIMNLLDGQLAAPYSIPIASYRTQVQKETDDKVLAFYPFEVKVNDWSMIALFDQGKYKYKMNLDLDIQRLDNIVVDQNFSKMKVELVDVLGRVLGSQTLPFIGANRLVTGNQYLTFDNIRTEQFEDQLTVNVYEAIDTPFGEVKRLVKTLKPR
ncbi:hypothetical protein O9H85_29630 [Paenibacillus filicis]|uniref:Uncharacterized protein n=1 Tax=Paenibacillus gyeongsangnamensis TaxID=3388067 RepID=A0ABT4QIG8_9BACL|nr:hypothetical protein [Paenibacillus filicis]MCZ8516475.1 hypothetical protein [Paenibacillus filicis]